MKRHAAQLKYSQGLDGSLSARLQLRTDLHLARKAWHMGMGVLIAFIYNSGLPVVTSIAILSCFLAFVMAIEFLRLRHSKVNETMVRLWHPVMRSCELNRMTGIPFYLASSILAIAIFPKPVAVLSILFLACGDPIASLMGILFGDRSVRFSNGKSLIGTVSGVVACALVAFFYLRSLALPPSVTLALTFIGGIAGGTAEMVPVDADDNFTIPVFSGFALWFAFIVLGI